MKHRKPYTMAEFEAALWPNLILLAAIWLLGALLTGCGAPS